MRGQIRLLFPFRYIRLSLQNVCCAAAHRRIREGFAVTSLSARTATPPGTQTQKIFASESQTDGSSFNRLVNMFKASRRLAARIAML
jgi:hypothetical protein